MRFSQRIGALSQKTSSAFWLSLCCLLTWWFLSGQSRQGITLHRYHAPAASHWISTQQDQHYTGCFRKEITCLTEIERAWVAVSSEGGFELLCNGNPIGAQTYWRPTRPFQNGLTEAGQRITSTEPLIAYNFPREYQWSGHRNDLLLTFFDLTPYLRKGKNSLCLEIEARASSPAAIAFGSIQLRGGKTISINTDESWKAEPVPLSLRQNHWTQTQQNVSHWRNAKLQERSKSFLSPVPPHLFQNCIPKKWIHSSDKSKTSEFSASFSHSRASGILTLLTHSNYWLWINDHLVEPTRYQKNTYNGGEWDVTWEGRRPLATPPVLLDPDETHSFFGGKRFTDPRHGDPTTNDFKRYENTLNRTRERPNQTGEIFLDDPDEEKGRLQDPYGFLEEPETAIPHSLLRERHQPTLQGFDISQLLRSGENTIRLRLITDPISQNTPAQFAISGSDGLAELVWNEEAIEGTLIHAKDLPALKFMGTCSHQIQLGRLGVIFLILTGLFSLLGQRLQLLKTPAILISALFGLALILQSCFQERSEALWFLSNTWSYGVPFGVLFLMIVIRFWPKGAGANRSLSRWALPLLLILTFLLRAWKIDHQPIDDDEYASIQAILSIVETGKPQIADEIWYSRSPLYHYAAAGVAKVFGSHIWSLRLYSVLLSVLTGWFLYYLARRSLRSDGLAAVALLIFALHPFLIFSGHIARFYQQQQLMVMIMLFLFIEGFLRARSVKARVGAILVFAAAVLSQEISISFVPVFAVLYLLFGKGAPLKWDFKSSLYLLFAGTLILADIALFQVKCLTRSVGVSPNVEATLSPTFWELGNLFSMFIGYSRLHLALSIFYLFSLIYSLRRGNRYFITLHLMLLISIIAFNFLITSVSFRYMYSIIPLWILLGVHGLEIFSRWISSKTHPSKASPIRWIATTIVILSFAPWRIAGSYDKKILGDPISSLAYVRSQLRPNDKVMITEPHPHAAKIELGRVDYDLALPILYDFTYNNKGVLRDRNGNAVVVNRLAHLQRIFREEKRVWIIVNREKLRSRKKNIRWEYPGAREELFLRENCDLKYRSYLWSVFLWDQSSGNTRSFRNESDSYLE